MDRLHWMGLAALLCTLPACAASQRDLTVPRRHHESPTEAIERGGRVSISSFALAGRVSWQSLRTVGAGIRGLFTGGTGSAQRNWNAGANRTREIAKREADRVKESAR